MSRLRNRRHVIEHDNVHRWLVSYADYMTLLFALFVVLYAMAMVNEKPFDAITESFGRVFQADDELPKERGQGSDILPVDSQDNQQSLYGDGILEYAGADLVEGKPLLMDLGVTQIGSELSTLEGELHKSLQELEQAGYAKLELKGDWLEIELSSGMMFASGSSSMTSSAKAVLGVINTKLKDVANYIRVRGYTDNQPINTEVFESNWELSISRATAILHVLERLNINPARMAVEGYGQYSPKAENDTEQGRAKNRRVVIAISKYALPATQALKVSEAETVKLEQQITTALAPDNAIKVIKLANGGIRITTSENK